MGDGDKLDNLIETVNQIHTKVAVIDSKLKGATTLANCEKIQKKIEQKIQSIKIWSLARDGFLLFAINVIAVLAGIKIAFPHIKLF